MAWFHSERLGCYVSLQPLKISDTVQAAARECGIVLDWDDSGNIIDLDFDEGKRLLAALRGFLLSPTEYWQVYQEAAAAGRQDVVDSLSSSSFAEMLDRVYLPDHTWIDHPVLRGHYTYEGEHHADWPMEGRPGWFRPEDIDDASGHPFRLHPKGTAQGLMKYWSPDLAVSRVHTCYAMRGYVTSVASMSLDLGIPVNSSQKKLMVRLCTRTAPEEFFTADEQQAIAAACASDSPDELAAFTQSELFRRIAGSTSPESLAVTEKIYDSLGRQRISLPCRLTVLSAADFDRWLSGLHQQLAGALRDGRQILLVCGHENPDSDAVISSVLEAYRFHLTKAYAYLPVFPYVQADRIPKEIERILSPRRAGWLILRQDVDVLSLLAAGRVRFVFTDQNYQGEFQKYVICITDHHKRSASLGETLPVPCHIELVGSCTGLVVRKMCGMGYWPDRELARIACSAMLMDTENRSALKMTAWDREVMDLVRGTAGVQESALYSSLMQELISETDPETLYHRDYKSFRGFGFAVLKTSGALSSAVGGVDALVRIAREDNRKNHFYFTLMKMVVYSADGLDVEKERLYYIFHDRADPGLRDLLRQLLYQIIHLSFPAAEVTVRENYIETVGAHRQLSRKKIAPAIETLLHYYGQYTYVKSIGRWVAGDFLHVSDAVRQAWDETKAQGREGAQLHADAAGRVCSITFEDAKRLCCRLGCGMLSLKEYWAVYREAQEEHDRELLASLTDPEFIEFLDTCCDHGMMVYHPGAGEERAAGDILTAKPGLILPEEIDPATGLPGVVHREEEQNERFWRYWSPLPDGLYIFSRSYIFLLSEPCLDAKTRQGEGFESMGIRPVRERNLQMDIRIAAEDGALVIHYRSELEPEDQVIYREAGFTE